MQIYSNFELFYCDKNGSWFFTDNSKQVLFFLRVSLLIRPLPTSLCSTGLGGCKWQLYRESLPYLLQQSGLTSLVILIIDCSLYSQWHIAHKHLLLPVLGKSLKSSTRDSVSWVVNLVPKMEKYKETLKRLNLKGSETPCQINFMLRRFFLVFLSFPHFVSFFGFFVCFSVLSQSFLLFILCFSEVPIQPCSTCGENYLISWLFFIDKKTGSKNFKLW